MVRIDPTGMLDENWVTSTIAGVQGRMGMNNIIDGTTVTVNGDGDDKKKKSNKNELYVLGGMAGLTGGALAFPFQNEALNTLNELKLLGTSSSELSHLTTYSKMLNRIGTGFYFLGVVSSIGQFNENPSLSQGLKSVADLGFGYAMTYGGIPGFTIGFIYFGLDYTVGWENIMKEYTRSLIDAYRNPELYPLGDGNILMQYFK